PVALVTGITGQDGSLLVERLLAEGYVVHGVVRPGEPGLPPGDAAGLVLHELEITDSDRVIGLLREVAPDEVYNLAGVSSVAASWNAPVETGLVNGVAVASILEGALRVAEDCGRAPAVVQATSAEIFGWPVTAPQDESTPVAPISPYGASKAYAHHLVRTYRARGVRASSCILYNHESTRRPETFVTRKITAGVARIARGEQSGLVMGNLDARRDWGWAPDYVDAIVRAARLGQGDDFVVATGEAHSVADFVSAAFARVGVQDWRPYVSTDPRFARPVDAPELVGDASKARRVLGWAPTVTFGELVARMVEHDLQGA
ncbi:MAG: GDP-mannose 4,6-dehydratase, partial [Cellulomonadaceae bacterium]|nr:GDP-mannose 4,6-dehydratase [Cellulomonadaceae bacterium]